MTTQIKYVRIHSLQCRGPIDPLPDRPTDGTLLSAETPCLVFQYDHGRTGYDLVALYPAFHNGEQCWIRSATWQAANGYNASGTTSDVITFDDGIRILVERGVFHHPSPDESCPVPGVDAPLGTMPIGTRVKVVKSSGGEEDFFQVGELGVVDGIDLDDDSLTYEVRFNRRIATGSRQEWFNVDHIEAV